MAETVSERLRQLLTTRANGRCEYCQSPEASATERFSVEHIQPRATGGLTIAENLALACQGCNGHKAAKTAAVDVETQTSVPLFHSRRHLWPEHFALSEDLLHVVGLTPTGRATVAPLHLNRNSPLNLRRALIAIICATRASRFSFVALMPRIIVTHLTRCVGSAVGDGDSSYAPCDDHRASAGKRCHT